jgi:hypothetical protein
VFDADEKRAALAILSDTTRNGAFEELLDDESVFITDAAPGPLSFNRAEVALLGDEIRPAVAAAAGVPASDVRITPETGSVQASVELPWIEGEKAKDLIERAFITARALRPVAARKNVSVHLRLGPLDLAVLSRKREGAEPYVGLLSGGFWVTDPQASSLVLENPVRTSLSYSSNETLTGALENTGSEPTPPIEVFTKVFSGYDDKRQVREVSKKLGSIGPGKRVKWSLILMDVGYGSKPRALFRADGKRIEVRNKYTYDHAVDWLDAAIEARADHGVWAEDEGAGRDAAAMRVLLTAEQAALPEREREELFRKIAKAFKDHRSRFHRDEWGATIARISFEAPGGGGWRFDEGKVTSERFEGAAGKKP